MILMSLIQHSALPPSHLPRPVLDLGCATRGITAGLQNLSIPGKLNGLSACFYRSSVPMGVNMRALSTLQLWQDWT